MDEIECPLSEVKDVHFFRLLVNSEWNVRKRIPVVIKRTPNITGIVGELLARIALTVVAITNSNERIDEISVGDAC